MLVFANMIVSLALGALASYFCYGPRINTRSTAGLYGGLTLSSLPKRRPNIPRLMDHREVKTPERTTRGPTLLKSIMTTARKGKVL